METLGRVSRAHRERLRPCIEQVRLLADRLDRSAVAACLPALRDVQHCLSSEVLPHMEAVEAAVHPMLERIRADRRVPDVLAQEHDEIRRLVDLVGEFAAHPEAHADPDTGPVPGDALRQLCDLLTRHLAEEERRLASLEGRLTPGQEAALARALDHAVERL
jgi:iron-sulfur cluster repair protein YtfE (RIC family)